MTAVVVVENWVMYGWHSLRSCGSLWNFHGVVGWVSKMQMLVYFDEYSVSIYQGTSSAMTWSKDIQKRTMSC